MQNVNKIIFECADAALSQFEFVDKAAFYRLLESAGVKPEEIGLSYEVFHGALRKSVGVKHFRIERVILQILKERTKNGVYTHSDEIEAFNIITESMMKETDDNLKRVKELTNLKKYTEDLKKIVKEQDDRLKSTERMAAIGETAAMVGHDIRNPLQAITSDLYLIEEELKNPSVDKKAVSESLNSINLNVSYINKIISDLQDYAKPLHPEYSIVNLAELIDSVFQIVSLPKNISYQADIADGFELNTDLSFLRRALTNLITNAIQAMPKGGKLTLSARRRNESVLITVSDTGEGISEEVQEKMFKPLVTTKSKGQGLGLAVVKRLIDTLDGKITFESHKDTGTKFIIELPEKKQFSLT